TLLIEGGATGADNLARRWAIARGIAVATYRADWDRYQHRAVPVRNAQMLREGHPELVVAFKGGRGTAHMVTIAAAALVPVLKTWNRRFSWEPLNYLASPVSLRAGQPSHR
ncbi:MAG: SLOG family protein, partial [Variovorax sp.]